MERIAICGLLFAASMAAFVEDNRTVTKRFALSAGADPEIVVAVITGGIRVTAHDAREVSLTAKVHYEAADAAQLDDLKKRLRFDAEQRGNNVWVGVEGEDHGNSWRRPREFGWRSQASSGGREDSRRWRYRHDVELRVPRTAHLKLSTVNGGSIEVDGVAGQFQLNNVNGAIDMKGANGFGRARTVNGGVTLAFEQNPSGPTSVKTVNGAIRMSFAKNLNADFKLRTVNGGVWTDFPPSAVNASLPMEERGMKLIWSSNRQRSLRVGSGGTQIEAEGVNTSIHVLQKKD